MAKAKEWLIRTISGIVFLAVILFCILYNKYTGWALFAVIGAGCFYEWFHLMRTTDFNRFFKNIFPFFYIGVPVGIACYLCYARPELLIFIFVLIWVNDIMAFVFGSLFGKHKFSRYSPSKTWEGTVGGIIFSVAASVLLWHFFAEDYFLPFLLWWILFGIAVAAASVLGDLFESYIKRKADVKDSGKIMPGHGGFLDRFDSFLFAVILAVIILLV
ncbi:MAG: phosphatidate cytidylyltransferase [Bacteroidales bacterium]|jgi:CDP-diglyceride synthetase|nr:phosphatidate cytidylyltransferase [Bacteroidales bacterium]